MNDRMNDAINELAKTLSKTFGHYEPEFYNIIQSWATRNFEVYSQKYSIVKEYSTLESRKHMQENCFLKLAHELGKTCGVTNNKGHQYKPGWITKEPGLQYVDEFETSIYCLRRNPKN